jgi:GNAT superfamily N-acetyltransferase
MTTSANVQIRLADTDDLEEIGRLLPQVAGPHFAERFPGRSVAEFCRWKYFSNPTGDAAVGIAVDARRVVGLAAGVPKRIQLGSERIVAYELGDFITDPAYRKRGLFSTLIRMVCEEAVRRGAALAYVRPNESSFRILVSSLEFVEARKIDERRYIVPSGLIQRKTGFPSALTQAIGVDRLARYLALPDAAAPVSVEPTERFSRDFDEFWERTRRDYGFALARDSAYLNWRYADCPTPYRIWTARRNGHCAGYLVGLATSAEPMSFLVDLFTASEDAPAAAALLRQGIDSFLGDGAQLVCTWTLQAGAVSAGHRFLKRACAAAARPRLHLAMRFFNSEIGAAQLPSERWQLAAGDFDGI